jgi:hypothetical protein
MEDWILRGVVAGLVRVSDRGDRFPFGCAGCALLGRFDSGPERAPPDDVRGRRYAHDRLRQGGRFGRDSLQEPASHSKLSVHGEL